MAEDHRRVEPREMAIGMRSDPERIQELIEERERRERSDRGKPSHSFGEVLAAEAEEDDADEGEAAPDAEAAEAKGEVPAPLDAPAPLPRVPPDPRMAALHQMLDGKKK